MAVIRKRLSRAFKVKVALEALKGGKTQAQLSSEFGVHATQIKEWKDQALTAMNERFSLRRGRKKSTEVETSRLYEEIGRLKVELDCLKGKLGN